MRPFVKVLWSLAPIALLAALLMPLECVAQVAGQNVNMVSGTQWPTGDPFLQRQNEPSMAVSTRNPMHILAGANDYRTVDLETLLTGGTETGDSWLGLFKSFDGGYTWQSTLVPGCPELVPQCSDNNGSGHSALQGIYGAASDPVVRAGTNGMFYYAGLAFVRPASGALPGTPSAIFVARYNDLNNNENSDPITYIDTHAVAIGNTGGTGQFLDKPAMAVDIPRSGANTCSFTATEPGVTGSNGQPLTVNQSFAAGNVYVAYTEFLAANKNNGTPTQLMFTRSTDCGVTWSTPVQINKGTITSQGTAIAVNPVNGNVYVAWRQFASTGVSNAIMVAQSTNAGRTFGAPVQISTFQPFDQNTTGTSFRTNAYPSITTDMFGFVYVAFSAKGLGPGGDARVVAAGSIDGTHWTPAIMVDNPKQNSVTNPSGRGHQIMPAITFANGRLTILYYDLRYDHYVNFYTPGTPSGTYTSVLTPEGELAAPLFNPNEIFTPYIDDFGLTVRRHTIDLRVLELGIFPTVTLGPSVSVSQYAYGCCVPPGFVQQSPTNIEQYKFNVPNLPLFANGSEPFLGDYIEVVPSPMFVPHGTGWAYNFTPSVNPLFHATWTDNRDVVPPADGNWGNYTPPIIAGTTGTQMSIFEPGQTLPSCRVGQEGMRNQNIYTAQITGGLVVGAPGNAKPLGTTTFTNPVTGVTSIVPFQRAFAVEAQNVASQPIFVRFTIANQPTGGSASFLQFSQLTTLDVTIPQYSSVSRSVFVTSTNPQASVTVNVAQISAIGGSVVTNGLSASAVLNPDISNPNISNPNISNPNISNPNISNAEVTDPNISNPNISNPNISNPNISNPNISNPNISNPNISNPNISNVSATNPNISNQSTPNPNISNPDTANPNISNPNISNPNISNNTIEDVIYPMSNQGNTTATYNVQVASASNSGVPAGIVVQLIINKLYQTPVADQCKLGVETHWVTVSNIINPTLYGPTSAGLGTPNISNPNPTEGSVTLAPGETAYVTLRVQNPLMTPAQQQFNPVTAIAPVAIPHAVDTITVLSNPGNTTLTGPVVYPQLTITTAALPATDQNTTGYSFQLQSTGGKPGADTWSLVSSSQQGFSVSSSGLLTAPALGLGPNSVTVKVTDSAVPANTTTKVFSIPVNNSFQVQTLGQINDGVVGQSLIAFPFTTTGGTGPIIWTATGLPLGLSINASTGQVGGIPTVANQPGFVPPATITATDSALPPSVLNVQITIRVGAVITITPPTLLSGTLGTPYSAQLTATGGIGNLVFFITQLPGGGVLDSNGHITISSPSQSLVSFTAAVHDQANPFQTASANYTISFAALGSGQVVFNTQPGNSIGGQVIAGSPISVTVFDPSHAVVPGVQVVMSLSPSPCPTAALGGATTALTDQAGVAGFGTLTIDRGGVGYQLMATAGGAVSATSNAFTVNGFCGTGLTAQGVLQPTATLLVTGQQAGQVLLTGGQTDQGPSYTNNGELYDPVAGTFSFANGTMSSARFGHTATLLSDGNVLVAGGLSAASTFAATADIFFPGNNVFSPTKGAPHNLRASHTATLLMDGTVLIAGGTNAGGLVAPAEIYSPASGTFTAVGSLNDPRQFHTATLLPNGQVLIAGGADSGGASAIAELYDPVAQTFSLVSNHLITPREYHTATLLSNGQVLIAGGMISDGVTALNSAELFNPAGGSFASTGNLNAARGIHTATAMTDGTVLLAGGLATTATITSAESYNVGSGNFTFTGGLVTGRYHHTATLLNNGTVLMAGGAGANPFLQNAEVYYSTAPPTPVSIVTDTLPNAPTDSGTPALPYGAGLLTSGGGGGTLTFSQTAGALPAGFTLNTSTGAITATAVTAPVGNYNFTIQVVSTGPPSSNASKSFTLTLVPFFNGTTPNTLPAGTEGTPYSQNITSTGGITPFTYQYIFGSLPPGLSVSTINPTTGLVSGTPTTSGTFTFTISATDSSVPSQGYSEALTITVQPQPPTALSGINGGNHNTFLNWTASTATDVAGYKVYRGTSPGVYTTTISLNSPVTNYNDQGLATGTTYYYVVTAASSSGVESVFSNEVQVFIP